MYFPISSKGIVFWITVLLSILGTASLIFFNFPICSADNSFTSAKRSVLNSSNVKLSLANTDFKLFLANAEPPPSPTSPSFGFASFFAPASIPFSPFAVAILAAIPANIPAVWFPVKSVVYFWAPAPAAVAIPSFATIVAPLRNVRFPAEAAWPIGIIADAANAKTLSVR